MPSQQPPPVDANTVPTPTVPKSEIKREPAPVDEPTTPKPSVPASQIDRAPDPLPVITVPTVIPQSAIDRQPQPVTEDPIVENRGVTPITEVTAAVEIVPTPNVAPQQGTRTTVVSLPVAQDGNVVVPKPSLLNFIGNGVTVTSFNGLIANINITGGGGSSTYGNANVINLLSTGLAGNIIPLASNTYDLGSLTNQWNMVWTNSLMVQDYIRANAIIGNDTAVLANGSQHIQAYAQDSGFGIQTYDTTYKTWIFDNYGVLTVPLSIESASNQIKYGLGNLISWNDGGWTIGEYNGELTGTEGIRINPDIEGPVDITLPATQVANTTPTSVSNFLGNVVINSGSNYVSHQWKFGNDGNLTLPNFSSIAIYGTTTQFNTCANGFLGLNSYDLGGNNIAHISVSSTDKAVFIGTYDPVTENDYNWKFDDTGNLILPDTAGVSINYANGTPYGGGAANTGQWAFNNDTAYNNTNSGLYIQSSQGNNDGGAYFPYTDEGTTTRLYNISGAGIELSAGANTWILNPDASIQFPQINTPRGDAPSGSVYGYTLVIGDGENEAVITTPSGVEGNPDSQRLVINPGKGADFTSGEGGDIYLWAGRGGSGDGGNGISGGSGGDIKIRGGQGGGGFGAYGDGGYIRIEAGDSSDLGGSAGFIEITGGVSQDLTGGYVNISAGQGVTGGDANITGGTGTAGTGGAVRLTGGTSANGLPEYGNIYVQSGINTWVFDNTGDLTLPNGTIVGTPEGNGTTGVIAPITTEFLIETSSSPTEPPTTIVISGADFVAVNLTYTVNPLDSTSWIPAGYNPATDPYIQYDGEQWGIFVPGFGQALYVNTGTLNVPLEQWNINPPLGSVPPTGAYTYPGNYSHTWSFDSNGNLTLPGGGTIFGNPYTPSGAPGNTITLQPAGSGVITDQRLLIYPTAADGDHIHLASGNLYQTELFLGSDNLYVKLANTGNVVVNANDNNGNSSQYVFGADSTITFPDSGLSIDSGYNSGYAGFVAGSGVAAVMTELYSSGNTAAQILLNRPQVDHTIQLSLYPDSSDPATTWTFDDNGNLTVPGNMVINGNINVFGSDTALIQPTDNVPLALISSGSNAGTTTFWVEHINDPANSAIAGMYAPLQGTANVRIITGNNATTVNFWDFDNTGNLTAPGNVVANTFVSNAFNVVTAGSLFISSQYGLGTVGTILEQDGLLELVANGNGGCVLVGWDSTYGNGIGNVAQIYFNKVGGGEGNAILTTGNAAGTSYEWTFDDTGTLTLPNTVTIKTTSDYAIAIGVNAGTGGSSAVSLGSSAGANAQSFDAIAIGGQAGANTQGGGAIAIGGSAGADTQGSGAIAIGPNAGQFSQGTLAIAIGASAGYNVQASSSIVINATGTELNNITENSFVVAPIRNDVSNTANALYYNTSTNEITYGPAGGGSYGNANVASFLANFGSNSISTTGNVSSDNLATTGNANVLTLITRNGDSNNSNASPQIIMGYAGTADYPSFIHTTHNAGTPVNNTIEFWTCDGSQFGTFPANAVMGLTVTNGNIKTGGILTNNYYYANGTPVSFSGSSYGNANVADFLDSLGSNVIITTGNITGGNINATANVLANGYARLTGGFDESQASTAALYLGYAGGTPRIMFGTGNTNQTLEIDNDAGTLRFYKPGTTLASLTNSGDFSTAGNITGNTNGFAIGYRDIPQVTFSANATAGLTDAGKHYYSTTAGNLALTLPDNSSVAFATGTALTIVVNAAGNVLVNQGSGVSLYQAGSSTTGNRVVGAYGMATVMKVAANTWVINGTGVY